MNSDSPGIKRKAARARRKFEGFIGRTNGRIRQFYVLRTDWRGTARANTHRQIEDAVALCVQADRATREARKAGAKPTPMLAERVAQAERGLHAAAPLFVARPDLAETAGRRLLNARLRLHLMRRHAGQVFHAAEQAQWETTWDAEAVLLLLDAHEIVRTPPARLRSLFKRLRSLEDPEAAIRRYDAYLEATENWPLRLRRGFWGAATDPAGRPGLRQLVVSMGQKSLSDADRESLLRRAESIVAAPAASGALRPEAAMLAIGVARSLAQRLRALELYECVRHEARDDRSLHSLFQTFYVRLVYLMHTGGEADDVVQPLEQERWWTAYNQSHTGVSVLGQSSYWRSVTTEERARRSLFAPARLRRRPNEIVFLSNTPKFSFALMDLIRERGLTVHAVQFDFIEDLYRKNKMLDLLARPIEACASWGVRKQVFAHPLVQRIAAAECIFTDFANRAGVWASWFKRPHQRLILRLHAYEALSAWPHLINWAAVDGLVFVSPAIEAVFRRELGDRVAHIPSVVIPNFKVLPEPGEPRADSGRVLGMLGAVIYRKQPVQAVQILKVLQERDSVDWRLRLAGDYWPEQTSSPETEHKAEFEDLVARLPNPDSILIDGFQSDIAAWFSNIDFLLSCSLREGTHEAVNEAMHFGAIPVVRDWPLIASFGGARCVYPVLEEHGLLYKNIDEAVEGILAARENHQKVSTAMRGFAKTYLDNERNLDTLFELIDTV